MEVYTVIGQYRDNLSTEDTLLGPIAIELYLRYRDNPSTEDAVRSYNDRVVFPDMDKLSIYKGQNCLPYCIVLGCSYHC